jgi:hypothetical protein
MNEQFTDRARAVVAQAQREAQRLQHDYVGTEHLLLGLVEDGVGLGAEVLEALGATPQRVRAEIEALIAPGLAPTQGQLPLTPRAVRALEFAAEEATYMGQAEVDSEHVLLGLTREAETLASAVLAKLGLTLERVRREAVKIRMLQMTLVEKVVRPLRAAPSTKRRMREELLAHLAAIYDDEIAAGLNPVTAVRAAAERFGDPAELSRELQRSLPWRERIAWIAEWFLGWRAPETLGRYVTRLAVRMALFVAGAIFLGLMVAARFSHGWGVEWEVALRAAVAAMVLLPIAAAGIVYLYFRARNAHYGVFGARRSWRAAAAFAALSGVVGLGSLAAFVAIMDGDFARVRLMQVEYSLAAAVAGALVYGAARINGRAEIQDTIWALLDLDSQRVVDQG